MVYHDHDGVAPVRDREVRDEVHGNLGKGAAVGWRGNGQERHYSGVAVNFGLLARSTSIGELLDKGVEAGPPVVPLDEFECAEMAGVSHRKAAVISINYFSS
jgi:hypothetical protein